MSGEAYFRVDVAPEIGAGHFVRCVTLAKAFAQLNFDIVFLCAAISRDFESELDQLGFRLCVLNHKPEVSIADVDITQDIKLVKSYIDKKQSKPSLMVADQYSIGQQWHEAIREVVTYLLVVDDLNNRFYSCDGLLDQTYGKNRQAYEPWVGPNTTMYIGSEYALVRDEFLAFRQISLSRRHREKEIKRILITLGAADINNLTLTTLNALDLMVKGQNLEVDIVLGAICPHVDVIREQLAGLPSISATLHVATRDMAGLMKNADLCISAAGSTLWECCVLGLPVIAFTTADNQKMIAALLADKKAIIYGGDLIALTTKELAKFMAEIIWNPAKCAALSLVAREVCDGRGAQRIASSIESELKAKEYHA